MGKLLSADGTGWNGRLGDNQDTTVSVPDFDSGFECGV